MVRQLEIDTAIEYVLQYIEAALVGKILRPIWKAY